MCNQVVPSYPTHEKRHSPFYEGNHGNDDLPFLSVGKPLTQSTVPQRNSLGNVVLNPKSIHTNGRIYEVSESTHLSKLKGSEGNVFEKGVKVRRLRRLAKNKRA